MELTELHKGIIAIFFTLVFASYFAWALDRLDPERDLKKQKPKQPLTTSL